MTTSTRPSRHQLDIQGRTFSIAYLRGGGRWEAWCAKLDITVFGASDNQALFNMQKAIEYTLACQGVARTVHVPCW